MFGFRVNVRGSTASGVHGDMQAYRGVRFEPKFCRAIGIRGPGFAWCSV